MRSVPPSGRPCGNSQGVPRAGASPPSRPREYRTRSMTFTLKPRRGDFHLNSNYLEVGKVGLPPLFVGPQTSKQVLSSKCSTSADRCQRLPGDYAITGARVESAYGASGG